jgi:carbamoyl-phosphate synthase large subunit
MRALTLLLLSGGGRTGSNVMATLAARRNGLRLVATSDGPDEPALFNFDAVYLTPTMTRDRHAFEQRALEVIAREEPDLVVPCRDEDVEWLAGLGERHPDLGPRLLCGPTLIAEMANDKWLSYGFCRAHGLPYAPSLPSGDAALARAFVDEHGLPLVAKPRRGVDSRGVFIVTTAAQAAAAMARPGYLLQQYLGGPQRVEAYLAGLQQDGIPLFHTLQAVKHSLQALIGPDGKTEHVVCTRIQAIGHGARSVMPDADPEPNRSGALCARAFAEAGWRGPLNVQCELASDGALMIHEFNVRFTGSTHNRWLLGVDEVGAAIRAFTGRTIDAGFPWREPPSAVLENLAPRAADRASVRRLADRGEWQRVNP